MRKNKVVRGVLDWTNPNSLISEYFTVREALYLPSWDVIHIPSAEEQASILSFALKMDMVREFLKKPITILCWIRPVLNNPSSPYHGQDYNSAINGKEKSMHKLGRAADWSCKESCDTTRAKLLPKLKEFDLRMEDKPQSNWVHTDDKPVGAGQRRFFRP